MDLNKIKEYLEKPVSIPDGVATTASVVPNMIYNELKGLIGDGVEQTIKNDHQKYTIVRIQDNHPLVGGFFGVIGSYTDTYDYTDVPHFGLWAYLPVGAEKEIGFGQRIPELNIWTKFIQISWHSEKGAKLQERLIFKYDFGFNPVKISEPSIPLMHIIVMRAQVMISHFSEEASFWEFDKWPSRKRSKS